MLIRSRETNRPLRRATLLLLSAAVLVVMSSRGARSEAPQPPANPAPSHQESAPLQSQPDASSPGRSRDTAQAEWRLRILEFDGPLHCRAHGPISQVAARNVLSGVRA